MTAPSLVDLAHLARSARHRRSAAALLPDTDPRKRQLILECLALRLQSAGLRYALALRGR